MARLNLDQKEPGQKPNKSLGRIRPDKDWHDFGCKTNIGSRNCMRTSRGLARAGWGPAQGKDR
eukprot:2334534-Pyramimonas_sp.AAC.1